MLPFSAAVRPQFRQAVGAEGILHGLPVLPTGSDGCDAYLRFVGTAPYGEVQKPSGCAGYD